MQKLMAKKQLQQLYLISDSSGNLLQHFFAAVLTQFPKHRFDVHPVSFVKDEAAFFSMLSQMQNGVVFHAVVSPSLKSFVARECAARNIPCCDVTGPTVAFLERAAGVKMSRVPRPLHPLDEHYKSRIDALEFSIQHDDNRRIEELEKAEIILVGISRVSKSPNALFLAYRGFLVANVSWDPKVGLPDILNEHCRRNVVALTAKPAKLVEIRKRRFAKWNLVNFEYNEISNVIREVMEAERKYKEKGWPVIDATDLTVEETSSMILEKLGLKPKVFAEL